MDGVGNTRLVGGEVSGKGIMEDVDVVFTLTGTVAFEALERGKQVIHYGSPWWEGCPGTSKAKLGSGPANSLPDNLHTYPTSFEVWNYLADRIKKLGIFYPANLQRDSEGALATPELTRVLQGWLRLDREVRS
jgi:hypothetical protein